MESIRSLLASSAPHSTPDLAPSLAVPTPARAVFLRFGAGDKLVLAAMLDGSLGVWRLKSLVQGDPTPLHLFPSATPSTLYDLLPNPSPTLPLVALVSSESLALYNLETRSVAYTFPVELQATAACWSVKGKQIAVGNRRGFIGQFTPDGQGKGEIGLPPALAGQDWEVRSLHWLENTVFLASYAKSSTDASINHDSEVYIITTSPGSAPSFVHIYDPAPPFGLTSRHVRRWVTRIRAWEPFRHLLFMANAPSLEVGAIGQQNDWTVLNLPETSRPTLPNTDTGDETCPLGLELDLSSTTPTYIGSGEERTERPPSPNLMVYTSAGVLVVWRLVNEKGARHDQVRPAFDVLTREDAAQELESQPASISQSTPSATPMAVATPPAFGAPTSSPFGAPSASPFGAPSSSPFGAPGSSAFGTPSAFGKSPFGAATTPSAPAFGSSAFGSSSFGTPAAPAPAFGASTSGAGGFAGFGAKTPNGGAFAGFGASATAGFAAAATSPATSSDSASPFGSGTKFVATPVFGGGVTAAKPAAFGSSPFGEAAKPAPAFGASSFASSPSSSAAPSAGGFAGFGSGATSSTSQAPSAFGSTTSSAPASGGFGAFSANGSTSTAPTGFGSFSASPGASPFAPGKPSGFGSSPTSAFGSSSTSAFPKAPTSSAFASPSASSAFSSNGTAKFNPSSSPTGNGTLKPTFSARMADDSDSDGEDMGETSEGRVDEPPDLEPTMQNQDLSKAMAAAPTSLDRRVENKSASPKPASTGLDAMGSLGFGGTSTASSALPPATSIFGSAAPVAVKTPPTTGFGFGSALPPAKGFSFNSSSAAPTSPPPATASPAVSTFSIGGAAAASSPLGAPSSSPFGTPSSSPFAQSTSAPALALGSGFSKPSTPPVASSTPPPIEPEASTRVESSSKPVQIVAPTPSAPTTSAPSVLERAASFGPAPEPEEAKPTTTEVPEKPSASQSKPSIPPASASTSIPEPKASMAAPSSSTAPAASTKSLFGFASSPPSTPVAPSFLSRLSASSVTAEDLEEQEGGDEDEDEDENEDEGQEEQEGDQDGEYGVDEVEEEQFDDEEPDGYQNPYSDDEGEADETQGDESDRTEVVDASPTKAAAPSTPSLLSRMSPSTTPSTSPSTTPASTPAGAAPFGGFNAPPGGGFGTPSPKPVAGGFSFGAPVPPPAASKGAIAKPDTASGTTPAAPAASFSFGSAPKPTPPVAASAPLPLSFGPSSSAPRTSSPLARPGLSAPLEAPKFAPPAAKVPAAQPPAFGFGQAPAAQPAPVSQPSFSLPPTLSGTSPFVVPKPQSTVPPPKLQAAPPMQTPQPASQIRPPFQLASTSTPKVGHKLGNASVPPVQETGMAGEFVKAYQLLQQEFKLVQSNTEVCKSFIKELRQTYQLPDRPVSYDAQTWSMGDLKQLASLTDKLKPSTLAVVEAALVQKRQVDHLQSLLLKAETKREEAARFIRARSDPVFAKMVRVRQLGPEQVENQKRLRQSVEAVKSRVVQLEEHMMTLKDKVTEQRLGRSSFKTPSLDAVSRAVRNISVAVSERALEIDDLTLRLDLVRVTPAAQSTPRSRRRSLSTDASLTTSVLRGSPKQQQSLGLPMHPGVVATAKAALGAERSGSVLKRALLSVRATPLRNTTACSAPEKSVHSDLQLAFAAGPITAGNLPKPRRPAPPASAPAPPTPNAQSWAAPSLPAWSTGSPSPTPSAPTWSMQTPPAPPSAFPAFKAPTSISFSAPVVAASTSPSAGSSRGAAKNHRVHSAAAQIRASPVASTPPPASSFDWGVPPSRGPAQVSQFISLSPAASPTPAPPRSFFGNGNAATQQPPEQDGEDETFEEDEEDYDDYDEEDPEEYDEEAEGLSPVAESEEED